MRAVWVTVCLLGVLGVAGACGSSTSGSVAADHGTSTAPTSSPSTPSSGPSKTQHASKGPQEPSWADCGTVWKAGERLPAAYPGCNQGATSIAADRLGCSSGQRLVRFDNHWWAAAGGEIHHSADLMHDNTYIHSAQVCRG